ncbi:MAG: DeoR family transcriptional regulator [Phenylobacterium sp.]|nr:DeoR family transcriptional regulator [Phenylobacterium sp.]
MGFVSGARRLERGLVVDSELRERVAVRMAIGAILRAVEMVNREYDGDITAALVFAAVVEANVGHLATNPQSTAQLTTLVRLPPDELRRPVTGVALAATLGIPNETVRRKVKGLIEQGLLVRVDGGLIVPTQVMASEKMTRLTRASFLNLRRLFIQLRRIGVDLSDDGAELEAAVA